MTKKELFEIYGDEVTNENIIETLCDFFDLDEVDDILNYNDYLLYFNCYDMTDVAREVVEECGYLNRCNNDIVERYFDYESFGRDLDIEGTFLYAGEGVYIEIIR